MSSTNFKKYSSNFSWLLAEKIVGLAVSFLVTAYVARSLGSANFGIVAYALSLTSLFSVAAHAGLNGIVTRDLVTLTDEEPTTMGTGWFLKACGAFLGFTLLNVFCFISPTFEQIERIAISISSLTLLLQPFQVVDYWFQAKMKNKYAVIARQLALVLSSTFKIVFVYLGLGLLFILGASLFQTILTVGAMMLFYRHHGGAVLDWQISSKRAKQLLQQGSLIFLGTFFAILYLKIDQIMIRELMGTEAVGIYAIASVLSEAWYFLPVAVVTTFYPKLIDTKKNNDANYKIFLQRLFDLLFFLAFVLAIVVNLIADPIINYVFGSEYGGASNILVIHIWAGVFIFMRALLSKWIIIENLLVFSLLTQGTGALINIMLNYFLIDTYGLVGAAYATLVSYCCASYLALILFPRTREVFWMMSKALVSPLRYPVMFFPDGNKR